MSTTRLNQPLQSAAALVLALVVLGLGLAGVSPAIHNALHSESGLCGVDIQHEHGSNSGDTHPTDSDHYCAVTLFQFGAAWSVTPNVPSTRSVRIEFYQKSPSAVSWESILLPNNRGPPIVEIA